MADDLRTEEEQLEDLRSWWNQYKAVILGGVAVTLVGIFGYNSYQASKVEAQVEASALYDELADDVVDSKLDDAEAAAARIENEYAGSAYVGQSKLAMARLYMDRNRDEDAANALRELLALGGLEELKQVARVRLAKVLLYQGKTEEALDTVAEVRAMDAFAARFAEVRGDILAAAQRFDEARDAYSFALEQSNATQTLDTGYVQLKLIDLPVSAAMADVSAEDAGE